MATLTAKQLLELTKNLGSPDTVMTAKPLADVEFSTGVIRLRVLDVRQFENNPRQASNEKIAEIRESIRSRGLDSPFKITKGGGRDFYVTAAGGGTRLSALHQLASGFPAPGVSEEQIQADARRFEFMDFLLHKYVSESDLLAGHLSENIQRSDMSFWDTAKGFSDMRRQLNIEHGAALSGSEFANVLSSAGLKTDPATLNIYEFAVKYYGNFEHKNELTRDNIRNELRPGYTTLRGLSEKHGKVELFDSSYLQWVALVALPKYSVSSFLSSLNASAASALGYSAEQFATLMAAFEINREAPLADLLAPPAPSTESASPSSVQSVESPESADALLNTENIDPVIGDPATPGTEADGVDDLAASDNYIETANDALDALSQFNTPAGLQVASGLVAIVPKAHQVAGVNHADGTQLSQDEPSSAQPDLPEMSSFEVAQTGFNDALLVCAELAGVTGYLKQAPAMRFGYFIDLPTKKGALGENPDDLAVMAWWFLANLSGQLSTQLVIRDDDPVLPDTGLGGYRAAISTPAAWAQAVQEYLGGVELLDSSYWFEVLLEPKHPLSSPGMALLMAMRTLNFELGQGPQAS